MKIKRELAILCLAGAVAFVPTPLQGHHAFQAEFDSTKPVTLCGRITRVDWLNPHAHVHLVVQDEPSSGLWELELASPNALMRRGWTRYTLKNGDMVRVSGYLARDGSRLASVRSITFLDGRKLHVGNTGDGGPDR